MAVILQLIDIYRKYGYEVRTGLNPYHFRCNRDAPFTAILKNGKPLSTGGGVALQEVYFFETLFKDYHPKNIFSIGNAFGWSTLMMSLLNPTSTVISLDAGCEGGDNELGIRLTNNIATNEGFKLSVIKGESPKDVPSVVTSKFIEPIDLVFIDGLHTERQQELDFLSVRPYCSNQCVYIFHDVINFNMVHGFERIAEISRLNSRVLYRTPSGIGILFPDNLTASVQNCINAFSESSAVIDGLRRQDNYLGRIKNKLISVIK